MSIARAIMAILTGIFLTTLHEESKTGSQKHSTDSGAANWFLPQIVGPRIGSYVDPGLVRHSAALTPGSRDAGTHVVTAHY